MVTFAAWFDRLPGTKRAYLARGTLERLREFYALRMSPNEAVAALRVLRGGRP